MIVDTSAVMAILLKEDDARIYLEALKNAPARRMSGVSRVELTIVAARKANPVAERLVETFLHEARITVVPISLDQITAAQAAHLTFGRGRHPAKLNLGDCFAYSLAKETGEPLLFKGGDFALTDVVPAL